MKSVSFATLGLCEPLLRALKEQGYERATPIQQVLIPALLSPKDIIAGAQTGTGKTAGFTLPILQLLALKVEAHYPKALILVPTRELARQLHTAIERYGKYLPLKSVVLYGGGNFKVQSNRIKQGVDIVVGTPGRILEHLQRKSIRLQGIEYLVLDEADTMLDMGFVHEISKILVYLPKARHTLLISATLSAGVKRLASEILHKPKRIEIDSMGTTATTVEQIIYPVYAEKKTELLSYMIGARNYQQVLVFVRKKEGADEVAEALNLSGLKSAVIHGGKSAGERTRALEGFKARKIRVLVATDIAARGLDIPDLSVVMNYDIPHVIGDYIHRIGRTGRAGIKGLAITLISPTERVALQEVEKLLGTKIPQERLEGYAPKELEQKGARNKEKAFTKTVGAFGNKRQKSSTFSKIKKRKTTKRDGFKVYDTDKNNQKKETKRSKRKR